MPTYDYVCKACDHEFEAFQSIMAEPLTECPKCNGEVKRKISGGSGLIFKGSGFYITDYKNKGEKKSETETKKVDSPKPKSESKEKPSKSSDKE
ncbi:zinc ribbon domain-containing protein [candidate division KSB1 bacterium]|nr:zinc ribbon domain-containing protein [candidate division KSB1 bacterium]